MSRVLPYLKRAPRTLIFWMIVLIFVFAGVRLAFPRGGFDEVRTGEVPIEIAAGDDGLWVLNYADHSVSLVDTETKEEVLEVGVGADVAPALSANDDGAWVILDDGDTIGRVDPETEAVEDRVDVAAVIDEGTVAQDLAAGPGFVWITTGEGGQMVRLDTESGQLGDVIDVGEVVVQPQVQGDSLWVYETDGITQYDGTTGEEQVKYDTSTFQVHEFFAAEDFIYVLANVDAFDKTGLLLRLDPDEPDGAANAARVRIMDSTPSHVAAEGDQVFVSGSGGMLFEYRSVADEPLTAVAAEQVTVSTKDLRTVVVDEETVWIADGENGVVHQPVEGVSGDPTATSTPR
jgi:streptogramin lyase